MWANMQRNWLTCTQLVGEYGTEKKSMAVSEITQLSSNGLMVKETALPPHQSQNGYQLYDPLYVAFEMTKL